MEATRYIAPLREGGSMPGLMEADDDGIYVVKFRGAGQGPLALVAEVIAAAVATALELPMPEVAAVKLDPDLGRAEPDPEIQELLQASEGLNFGIDFLPGAVAYSPASAWQPAPELAAEIVWLDALLTNVDRTALNPNLLIWHERLWIIDHGAALYRQHEGLADPKQARRPFPQIAAHVLLPVAGSITEADERLAPRLTEAVITDAVAQVPERWLTGEPAEVYRDHLLERLAEPREFVIEAENARTGP